MKTYQPFSRQLFVFILFCFMGTIAFSQHENTWIGGTPGMENDWNCAKNWSDFKVPDEFTNVFIPDVSTSTLYYPVIKKGVVEINAFYMKATASLTVLPDARLVVYSEAEGWEKINGTVFIVKEHEGVDPHETATTAKIMN